MHFTIAYLPLEHINMKKVYICFIFLMGMHAATAQWNSNTSVNTLVANADASDIQTANTTDGRTWIAFYSQSGNNYIMRAQLLDANGNRLLGDSGVMVSNLKSGSATYVFNVCVDNDNNLIIGFQVEKGSAFECLAQKVTPAGQLPWSIGVDLGPGLSPYPAVLSTGEIAVAWNNNNKINYQKLSSAGVKSWTPAKVFSGNSTHAVSRAQVVAGTNGSFSMVYQDQFSFPFYTHLFEQRFGNDGVALWASAVQLSTLTTVSYRYYDVHSENDTTYVGYYGNHAGTNRFDAYVQRVNPDGGLPLTADGADFSDYSGIDDPYEQTIYIAKVPGKPAVWAVCTVTNTSQTQSTVYVQRINSVTGARAFGNYARPIYRLSPKMVSLAFSQLSLCEDNALFLITDSDNTLAAIKVLREGDYGWNNYIRRLGSSTNTKFRYGFTNVTAGQAVAVWQEDKGSGNKPFAQNIICNGTTGFAPVDANTVSMVFDKKLQIQVVYPNPAREKITATVNAVKAGELAMYIISASGNAVMEQKTNVKEGVNAITVSTASLKSGSYFLKVVQGGVTASVGFYKE